MSSHITMEIIDKEFELMKELSENKLNNDISIYLDETHSKIQLRGIYNPRGPYKRSLAHFAAMGDCVTLLERLLDLGTPVDDLDQNKRTPLSWAAEYGSLRAAKALLKKRAKINSLDDMYRSPLTWLEYAGSTECKDLEATRSYLKENGATMRGAKRAWIFKKLRIL